jgi:hypothetical protein
VPRRPVLRQFFLLKKAHALAGVNVLAGLP